MAWLRSGKDRHGRRRFHLQWREGGRVRSRALGTDPVAAREALREARRGEGAPAVHVALGASDAVDRFVAHLRLRNASEGSVDHLARRLRGLVAEWPDIPLSRWSRAMLETYLARQTWRPRTVAIVIGAAKRWIAWGREAGVLIPDFVRGLKAPRKDRIETVPLSPEEAVRLLEAASRTRLDLPVALALLAGLSYGDLRALSWREVDLDAGRIVRRRAKTGTPVRVPIVPMLAEALRRGRATTGPVCRGLSRSRSADVALLHGLFELAGVGPSPAYRNGWHRLRHSCATLLQFLAVPPAVIGAILGHAPGSVMTMRYLHPSDVEVERAMAALAARLRTAGRGT